MLVFCSVLNKIKTSRPSDTINQGYLTWNLVLTNNDILRRLRYTFNFNDNKMISIFAMADARVTREQVSQWLKKEDDDGYANCTDSQLASFLNGLINDKRGKREGVQPVPEKRLNNNIILNKLKIALNLRAEDIIEIIAQTDLRIGKSELSAFFRKPDHKHFRQCKDQFLRNFLQGLQNKHRKDKPGKPSADSQSKQGQAKGKANSGKTPKKLYVNPNATPAEKPKRERKVLKLKPEDIWKQ